MIKIAYKRARSTPSLKESLHPDFITEFADTSLFPPNFHKKEDGWRIIPAQEFQVLYKNNEELQRQFLKQRQEQEEKQRQEQEEEQKNQKSGTEHQPSISINDFEEFLEWKRSKQQ